MFERGDSVSAIAASERSPAPIPSSRASPAPACSIRCSLSSAPTITPATTAPPAARRVTSSTPTTAIRLTPDPTPRTAAAASAATNDKTIPKGQSGHPIRHRLTRAIPTSQCVVCHMHPGTSFASQYTGYMWWDNETDGVHMYPDKSKKWSPEDQARALARNPEAASLRGKWSDPKFLARSQHRDQSQAPADAVRRLSRPRLGVPRGLQARSEGQLARQGRQGRSFNDPEKFKKAVHLKDIHLEKGMHCIDCHFEQDSHGNGKLYVEARGAVEIDCIDCHGYYLQAPHAEDIQLRLARYPARPFPPPHAVGPAALRVERRHARSSAPWSRRRIPGKSRRFTIRSGPHPVPGFTTKKRAWPKPSSATMPPGAAFPATRSCSPIRMSGCPATPATPRG